MVWSEQIGASLVLPSDRVNGDGRNYIVIGEDVPAEIASAFTAALVFRNGRFDGNNPAAMFPNGFVYWAFGITNIGALEIVAYYYVVTIPTGGSFQYYRQTVMSFAPPIGVDNPPVLSLGYNPNYGSFGEGALKVINNDSTPWTDFVTTWTTTGTQPVIGNGSIVCRYRRDGRAVHVRYFVQFGSTTTGGNGNWVFTLPFAPFNQSSHDEQTLHVKAFTSVGNFTGMAVLIPGNISMTPYLPTSQSDGRLLPVSNANSLNQVGTGVPASGSNFPFINNANLIIHGTYEANV